MQESIAIRSYCVFQALLNRKNYPPGGIEPGGIPTAKYAFEAITYLPKLLGRLFSQPNLALFFNLGQTWPIFVYFRPFLNTMTNKVQNWLLKCRWCE